MNTLLFVFLSLLFSLIDKVINVSKWFSFLCLLYGVESCYKGKAVPPWY